MNSMVAIRKSLKKQSIAAFLQPVNDEFMSEYPPEANQRVAFLTGFSGSAGTVVVHTEKAALFTDGRYTLQAKNEVDASVFELHNSATTTPEAWLAEHLAAGERVGYDPKLYTAATLRRMEAVLKKKAISLVPVANVIDPLWTQRPAAPATPLFIHEQRHAGQSSADKRALIARQMEKEGADMCVLSSPDSVCWLLNIRARDVECTPLALCVALIDHEGSVGLFVDAGRCSEAVLAHLGSDVELCPPAALENNLRALGVGQYKVLCDPASVPVWFTQTLSDEGAVIIEAPDPCVLPKATKNATELQGIRAAHLRDGAAIVKLLCWLDETVAKQSVSELDVSEKLLALRALSPDFVEPSFNTIAGSGPNGAIVHYRASEHSNRTLLQGELFLLDSGGQYPDGTTDITRTVAIGEPNAEHKDRFTRVLKGHIAIATAHFPEGTCGSQLDVLARHALWQAGLDYDHGTGHGVGCFLGVHEGPQRISKRGGDTALKVGMIVSNEPGYYKTGEYGIRIENLVTVVQKQPKWLGFDTLTCAPIDTRLVDVLQLTADEKSWLNDYHAWVFKSLSPQLETHERGWLELRCKMI